MQRTTSGLLTCARASPSLSRAVHRRHHRCPRRSTTSHISRSPGAILCVSDLQCTAYPEGPSDLRSGVPEFDSCRESAVPRRRRMLRPRAACLISPRPHGPPRGYTCGHQGGLLASPRPRKRTACRLVSPRRASSSRRWVAGVPPPVARPVLAPCHELDLEDPSCCQSEVPGHLSGSSHPS